MAEITAAIVKELREMTNAGMMDCKGALVEAGGDLQAAADILRKKSGIKADKKASRDANEGVIASALSDGAKSGVLTEVNCETDFVAKNENFSAFVAEVTGSVLSGDAADPAAALAGAHADATLDDYVKVKVAELGENLVLRRFTRFDVADGSNGVVGSYIHLAGKVGVLIEVGAPSADAETDEGFLELVKDLTLHIAASDPAAIGRDEVDADLVAKEREVYAEQMKDKPAEIIDKIVEGKLGKFYSEICLLEQGFVKDPDVTVKDLLAAKGSALGGDIEVRRFARFAVGESID